MSTTKVDATTCDLCGYGGPYAALNDFVRRGGFDFCRWCAQDGPSRGEVECGTHRVTIHGRNGWQCSCGQTYGLTVCMMRLRGVSLAVMDAVPNLGRATAMAHVQA